MPLQAVNVLWLFPTVPRIVPQCVIVVFPDQNHLLFALSCSIMYLYFICLDVSQVCYNYYLILDQIYTIHSIK